MKHTMKIKNKEGNKELLLNKDLKILKGAV